LNITEQFSGIRVTPGFMFQLLNRASRFGSCCFLDNSGYDSALHAHEFLLGCGEVASIELTPGGIPEKLDAFLDANKGKWIFAHFSYDYRQSLRVMDSEKPNPIGFAPARLFVPAVCLKGNAEEIQIAWSAPEVDMEAFFKEVMLEPLQPEPQVVVSLSPLIDRKHYVEIIQQLRAHILRGDCYEINFCQEFRAMPAPSAPLSIYKGLTHASPNPFSCFYKAGASYLMCASPERFLAKRGQQLFSQPIKGTAKRFPGDGRADDASREALRGSKKELSENVMVVDLVRNDLSKICERASVKVDELFGIYSYPQVHQMISTVSGVLRKGVPFSEIMAATFPMGSMTGAPKKRVMELIEHYEPSRRGLFSGAVGYFSPDGDFDFNVVIRSVLYNENTQYLSYQVGSGITWYSNPEDEYEECLLKAEAIRKVLGGDGQNGIHEYMNT